MSSQAIFEQVWVGESYDEAIAFLRRWFPDISEELANMLFIEYVGD